MKDFPNPDISKAITANNYFSDQKCSLKVRFFDAHKFVSDVSSFSKKEN